MAIYQWGSGPCGCIDTQGVLSLPEGGAVAIEPDPAESGDIRLPNGGSFKARNAANTADVLAVLVNAEDEVRLGSDPGAEVVLSADGKLRADGHTTLSWDATLVAPQVPLAVNAGAGSVAETGDLRLRRDFTIKARNAGDSADHILMRQDGSNNVYVGGAAPGVYLDAGGGSRFGALPTSVRSFVPRFEFFATVTAPLIHQIADTTASATGEPLTVQAQDCTGTTSTGGALVLRSGDGTTSDGEVRVSKGTTMSVVTSSGTEVLVGGDAIGSRPTVVALDGSAASALRVDGAPKVLAEPSLVTSSWPLAINSVAGNVATAGDLRLRNTATMTARNGSDNADVRIAMVAADDAVVLGHGDGTGAFLTLRSNGTSTLGAGSTEPLVVAPSLISFDRDVAIGSGTVASSGAVRLANNTAVTARKAGTGDVKLVALDDSDEVILGDTWARLGATHLQSEVKELRWAKTVAGPIISQESDNTASAVGETLTVVAQECAGADGIGGNLYLRPGRGDTHGELHLQDGVGNQRLTINPTGDVAINADSTFLLLRDSAEVVRVEDSVALADLPIKSTVTSGARSLLWTMTPTSPATNDHVVRLYRHQLGLEVTINAAWSGSQWEKDTATRASRLRLENDRLLLHFHNTITQTFSDAAWTGSFSQLPNTGANASITNAAELQGPGPNRGLRGSAVPASERRGEHQRRLGLHVPETLSGHAQLGDHHQPRLLRDLRLAQRVPDDGLRNRCMGRDDRLCRGDRLLLCPCRGVLRNSYAHRSDRSRHATRPLCPALRQLRGAAHPPLRSWSHRDAARPL